MKQSLEELVHCITYDGKQGGLIDELVHEATQAGCDTPTQVVDFLLDIVTKIKILRNELGNEFGAGVCNSHQLTGGAASM